MSEQASSSNWSNIFSNLLTIVVISAIIILATNTDIFKNQLQDLFKEKEKVKEIKIGEELLIPKYQKNAYTVDIKSYGQVNLIRVSKPVRFRSNNNAVINISKINIYDKSNNLVNPKVFPDNKDKNKLDNIIITNDSIDIELDNPVDISKIEIFPCEDLDVKSCYTCSIDKCKIEKKIIEVGKGMSYESPVYSEYNKCQMENCITECSKCLNDMIGTEITLIRLDDKNQQVNRSTYTIRYGDFIHELVVQ